MVFWIYCDYLYENSGLRNLIKIEPSVVLYNDTDAVQNGSEYNCDKPYSESENKENMLLLQNVEKS